MTASRPLSWKVPCARCFARCPGWHPVQVLSALLGNSGRQARHRAPGGILQRGQPDAPIQHAAAGPQTSCTWGRVLTVLCTPAIGPSSSDNKLAARAVAQQDGCAHHGVLDATQAAFHPLSWIKDTVLAHLEETQQLGSCSSWTSNRRLTDWTGPGWSAVCRRWLWTGPAAVGAHSARGHICQMVLNGWHTDPSQWSKSFPGLSSFTAAVCVSMPAPCGTCQAAGRQGAFQQLRLPSGVPALAIISMQTTPPSCALAPEYVALWTIVLGLHCRRATAAMLQLAKCQGHTEGSLPSSSGVQPAGVRHLCIPLPLDDGAAPEGLYTHLAAAGSQDQPVGRAPTQLPRQGLVSKADAGLCFDLPGHLHPHPTAPAEAHSAQPSTPVCS